MDSLTRRSSSGAAAKIAAKALLEIWPLFSNPTNSITLALLILRIEERSKAFFTPSISSITDIICSYSQPCYQRSTLRVPDQFYLRAQNSPLITVRLGRLLSRTDADAPRLKSGMRDQQIESPVVKSVRLRTFQTQSKVWQFSQFPVALDPHSTNTYSPIVYFG